MAFAALVLTLLALCDAVLLRGTLLVNVEQETQSLVTIDSDTGNVTLVKDWTSLGGALSGHSLRYGPQMQDLYLVTINIATAANTLYHTDLQGNILQQFTVDAPMATLEYSPVAKSLLTVSVTQQNQDVAAISFSGTHLTDKFDFDPTGLINVGSSCVDPVSGMFYTFSQAVPSTTVSLFRVQTAECHLFHCPSWTGTRNVTLLYPIAMEWYQGSIVLVNQNSLTSRYDIIRLNPNTMAQSTIVSLPPQYADSNGATAIYNGVLYLQVSDSQDTINTLVKVNLKTGATSYVSLGGNSIVAMLPPPSQSNRF